MVSTSAVSNRMSDRSVEVLPVPFAGGQVPTARPPSRVAGPTAWDMC